MLDRITPARLGHSRNTLDGRVDGELVDINPPDENNNRDIFPCSGDDDGQSMYSIPDMQ